MAQERGNFQSRINLVMCIIVAVMSIIGIGISVYKSNTGIETSWMPIVSEIGVLFAAGYFIFAPLGTGGCPGSTAAHGYPDRPGFGGDPQ